MTRNILVLSLLPLAFGLGCGDPSNCDEADCNGTVDTSDCTDCPDDEIVVEENGQCYRDVNTTTGGAGSWDCDFTVLAPEGIELDEVGNQTHGVVCENTSACTMTWGHGAVRLEAVDAEYLLVGAMPGDTSNFMVSISEDLQLTLSWQGEESEVLCDLTGDEACEISPWDFEGAYAVAFDKTCTDLSDGDEERIYSSPDDFQDGDGLIHLWGPPSTDALITNREIGGQGDTSYFTGYISEDGTYVLFQQWTEDDELYREKEYSCP